MFTHDALLGGEGAGVVVEVGPGVTEFSVGDSVFGFFPDGSGTLVAGDVRLLLPMPADWSYAEAAAISLSSPPRTTHSYIWPTYNRASAC